MVKWRTKKTHKIEWKSKKPIDSDIVLFDIDKNFQAVKTNDGFKIRFVTENGPKGYLDIGSKKVSEIISDFYNKKESAHMIEVWYVDGDKEQFEFTGIKPWEWIPEQQAYLIRSIEGDVIIPLACIKCLKHIEV